MVHMIYYDDKYNLIKKASMNDLREFIETL